MQARLALAPNIDTSLAALAETVARGDHDIMRMRDQRMREAVAAASGEVVTPGEANALVWMSVGEWEKLEEVLDANPGIRWVQLPWAGVNGIEDTDFLSRNIVFTSAKGAYAEHVGEHALALTLACLRHFPAQSRVRAWHPIEPESLFRKRVTILGGGGIAQTLVALLQPFNCTIMVVRRQPDAIPGVGSVVGTQQLHEVLPETDVLVLALALTPETRGIIGQKEFDLLPDTAVMVNVSRGGHIDTDALVSTLQNGRLAGVGLDVTDPEPLHYGHPLWELENVLITSHCADSLAFVTEKLAERVTENVRRFAAGEPLVGQVDPTAGY